MVELFANSETLIRRCILRRLIWVCTVCQLPFLGFPDYNGLMSGNWLDELIFRVITVFDIN